MIPHLAFPFTIAGPTANVVEQDTLDDIAQSVQIILTTLRGSRIELPNYGVEDLTFSAPLAFEDAMSAILEWEPRASVVFEEQPGMLDALVHSAIARVSHGGGS